MRTRIQLEGRRFGKLEVLKYEYTKNNQAYYLCRCDCGKEAILRGDTLRNGKTSSCGCGFEESKSKFGSRVAKYWVIGGVRYNQQELLAEFGIPNASFHRKLKAGMTVEDIIRFYSEKKANAKS